jgi:hypothetical protein
MFKVWHTTTVVNRNGMRRNTNAYTYLVGKPLARPRYRWEDNIKLVFKENERMWTRFV